MDLQGVNISTLGEESRVNSETNCIQDGQFSEVVSGMSPQKAVLGGFIALCELLGNRSPLAETSTSR